MQHGLQNLRELERKLFSKQTRFAVPFVYRGRGYFKTIEPRQNPAEIEDLYRIVCESNPSRVLEIGTAKGGTLYLWTQAASEEAVIVSVDLPGGEFGGAYPECRIPFYQGFAKPMQSLHLLRCNSHEMSTAEKVKELIESNLIDFLFIDGDHTYDGVKADFHLYGPMVRPGGLIAFHDILPRDDSPDIEVDRFWNEIKNQYETREFIGPAGTGRQIGIGLIIVSDTSIGPINYDMQKVIPCKKQ